MRTLLSIEIEELIRVFALENHLASPDDIKFSEVPNDWREVVLRIPEKIHMGIIYQESLPNDSRAFSRETIKLNIFQTIYGRYKIGYSQWTNTIFASKKARIP